MNLAIVLTAIRHGARAANHVKVERLLKDETGKLCGAHVKDMVGRIESLNTVVFSAYREWVGCPSKVHCQRYWSFHRRNPFNGKPWNRSNLSTKRWSTHSLTWLLHPRGFWFVRSFNVRRSRYFLLTVEFRRIFKYSCYSDGKRWPLLEQQTP